MIKAIKKFFKIIWQFICGKPAGWVEPEKMQEDMDAYKRMAKKLEED